MARSDSETDSRSALLERARRYARTVPVDVDHDAIAWECSERAKRRAGVCLFDRDSGTVTIRLTWAAHREHGWAATRGTIRHELVHAWEFQRFGESDHGRRFRRKARQVDAPRHGRAFAEPRVRLVCTAEGCDWAAGRHRASVAVRRPGPRRCGDCGAAYRVEHVATGETWRTAAGYEAARDRIGSAW